MMDVFLRSGFRVTSTSEYGAVSVRFSIEPNDASKAARAARDALVHQSPTPDGLVHVPNADRLLLG